MSRITYNTETMTITIEGVDDVANALGDLRNKTPAAVKVAVNATARQARKLMIARAKARYAVNEKGMKYLKVLKQQARATNANPSTTLYIKTPRNDLGYFRFSPKKTFTGGSVFANAPSYVTAKVLKASSMKPLTGTANLSKGFLVEYASGHVGMAQRVLGSNSRRRKTVKSGALRWKTSDGRVEKVKTMGSPSATAMHNTIWPEIEPEVVEYLHERLELQVERVMERARRKA